MCVVYMWEKACVCVVYMWVTVRVRVPVRVCIYTHPSVIVVDLLSPFS